MKLNISNKSDKTLLAFTLAEVSIGLMLLGIVSTACYTGLTSGFAFIELSRENLRATQIMVERMETIRLYRWDQVTNPTYIAPAFTNYYYPEGLASGAGGIMYTGAFSITSMPVGTPSAYSNDMRKVSVTIGWLSSKRPRTRSMTTYVARYGLQNYVYTGNTNSP